MNDNIHNMIHQHDSFIMFSESELMQYIKKYSLKYKYKYYEHCNNKIKSLITYRSNSYNIRVDENNRFILCDAEKLDKKYEDIYIFNTYKYESLFVYKLITIHEDNK